MTLLKLAWRNAGRSPRRTAIAMLAVAAGLTGALLSMSVNFGMIHQMVQTAIATELAHVQVHAPGYLQDPELGKRLADGGRAAAAVLGGLPQVQAWAPRIHAEGLLHSPRASAGVRVVAVDPEREARVSLVSDSVVEGSWFRAGDSRRVTLGGRLAARLRVGVGDKLVLSLQDLNGDLTAQAYRVGGIFVTSSRDLDSSAVFLRLDEAQALLSLGEAISEIAVIARDEAQVPGIRAALAEALGEAAEVRSWDEIQPFLLYMVQMFDSTAWLVYGAVFVAMAFGIANVLLMAISERTREIGMLLAMGMRRERVVAMVVVESLIVTLFGLLLGLTISSAAVYALRDGIDLSVYAEGLTAYGIGTRIVPVLRPADFGVPLVVAGVAALIASIWPAMRAASAKPAESLRHV